MKKIIIPIPLDITIYTHPICPLSKQLKHELDRFDVKYTEIDTSNKDNFREMVKKYDNDGIPLIIINDKIIRGLDKKRLIKFIKKPLNLKIKRNIMEYYFGKNIMKE